MIERRTLRGRLTALGVVTLLTCALLISASAAAAASLSQPYPASLSQPYPDALWREFPLDPRGQGNKASTLQEENATQTLSQSEKSEPTPGGGSESGFPLPRPVLLVLSLGAAVLLWLFAVGSRGNFRRFRPSELRSVVRPLQAGLRGGETLRTETSIVPRVEAALGGGPAVNEETTDDSAVYEETTDDASVARDTVADPSYPDKLAWLRAEVERARRGHDALSLLLVRSRQPAGRAEAEEDLTQALASAVEEALHDVPRELRRDGELISVILPHTLAEGAKRLAARVPLFVPEALPETSTHVSFRTAVACFPRDASTAEELLQICEQALAVERGGGSSG